MKKVIRVIDEPIGFDVASLLVIDFLVNVFDLSIAPKVLHRPDRKKINEK